MKSLAEKISSEQWERILVALDSVAKTISELTKLTKLTIGSVEKHVEVLVIAGLVARNTDALVSVR